jgi:hypothetical protein
LDGTTPSAIRNVIARMWSATTRIDTSLGHRPAVRRSGALADGGSRGVKASVS